MPVFEPINWYDFPGYYDVVHQDDTERESAFLHEVFRRFVQSRGRSVLEPACGSGRLLLAMRQKGYSVAGFDNNDRMLAAARRRLQRRAGRVHLFAGGLDDFSTRRKYDLAFCMISTFRHLLSETAARRHLRRIARVLRPGGVYVLGLHLSDYDGSHSYRERWTGRRGSLRVVCNLQSWPPERRRRRERQRLRVVVTREATVRRYQMEFWLRTYNARELRRLVRSVPSLELVRTFDFRYDVRRCGRLCDDQLDHILVLRRRR